MFDLSYTNILEPPLSALIYVMHGYMMCINLVLLLLYILQDVEKTNLVYDTADHIKRFPLTNMGTKTSSGML